MKTFDTFKYLNKEYGTKERSVHNIAKEWNRPDARVYPNTIRRCLIKYGIELRSKSVAQKKHLEKHGHPLQGRARTEGERRKISQGIQKHWDGMTDEEAADLKQRLSERGKEKWESMSEEEKKKIIHDMHVASRLRSGKGSKNEEKVADLLKEAGYSIIVRTKDFSPGRRFEIDIAIPSESTAVEWDGIAHFEAIYGDEALKRNMEKDERKNRALVQHGWTVIRCRDHSTAHSLAFCVRAASQIIKMIKRKKKRGVYFIDAE